jgi:transcriptional regulator with XRE-family HTH domain
MKSAADRINEDVGQRLRMLRLFMGKSQKSLAEALGVSLGQIEDYENGSSGIGAHLLAHLSAELNVPPAFFLDPALGGDAREAPESRDNRLARAL